MLGRKPTCLWKGWTYPDTDFTFNNEYKTLEELMEHVRNFEKNNEKQHIFNLRDVLEDYFCRNDEFFSQFCEEARKEDFVSGTLIKIRKAAVGVKALAKIKKKSLLNELKTISDEEIKENASICASCPLNKHKGKVGHESAYYRDIERAYDKPIAELDAEHGLAKELGKCDTGCSCKLATKVYLGVEDYGNSLFELPNPSLNNMIQAKPEVGGVCWQVKRAMRPEDVEAIQKAGKVSNKQLKELGYVQR